MNPGEASSYSPQLPGEKSRLAAQAELFQSLDQQLFNKALSKLPNKPTGLDIGCAHGYTTKERFQNLGEFETVIGVDQNAEALQEAELYCPDHWSFLQTSIESPEAGREIKAALNPRQPVLCLMAFVTMHLADPQAALKTLKQNLPKNSQLVIRTMDDQLHLAYPEKNIDKILHPKAPDLSAGDRQSGRKLHSQLREAGFREIEIIVEPIITTNLTPAERESLYQVLYAWRLDGLKEKARTDRQLQKELQQAEQALEELHQDMLNDDYFLLTAGVGAVATV